MVAPALARHGLRGTFYVPPARLVELAPVWRGLAMQGHEVGNGCLLDAAQGDGTLPGWTIEMVSEEVDAAESLLREVLPGQRWHSFGYPWGRARVPGGHDVREAVEPQVDTARSGADGLNAPASCDLLFLRCLMADGWTGDELVDLARQALESGKWGIFAFEGVGSGERGVDRAAHETLLRFLAEDAPVLWVAPVVVVGASLRQGHLRLSH